MSPFFSPAYDLNPTLNTTQSLLINRSSNSSDLGLLLDSSDEYLIPREEGALIIREVTEAVRKWQVLSRRLKISPREMEYFGRVFNRQRSQ